MNRPILLLPTLAVSLFAAPSFAAPSPEDETTRRDLDAVQGKWERPLPDQTGRVIGRAVKEIEGTKETISYFGPNGEVLQVHTVKITLERTPNVMVFHHSGIEITAGPNKGKKSPHPGAYLYKVEGDTFLEIQGLMIQEKSETMKVLKWQRVVEEDEVI